ncbi:tyrosine-type recombinase/integrase [Sulfuricurvum sp.]|uniref:tyrosine-type recombinase/integrase n=1 Tax=Sulfuricurvum sp. TaxID=2025608 RepID=UPI0026309E49|nr:tyrosine-type recombinase/integrase [Sulfuricurvum sp.]MDD4885130.1 tyrosine-type recombinase/integrase [Sulfuricurvum sp.]
MAQRLVKIDIKGYRCKGIYLEDNARLFDVDIIDTDKLANKMKPPFKLILRTTVLKNEKKITSKRTFSFDEAGMTLKRAIDKVNKLRDDFREEIIAPKVVKLLEDTKSKETEESKRNITLGEYWDNYYIPFKESTVNAKQSWKPSTAKDMKSFFNTWIKDTPLSQMRLVDIREEQIEELIKHIQSTRSKRTSKKVIEALSPLIKRFYKQNKINELNPADIDIGDLDNKREVIISIPMAKSLYDAMMNYEVPKYRDIFVWLASGRRLSEVLTLTIFDIDIKLGIFHIIPDNNKAGKRTTFILRSEMLETLEDKKMLIHPSQNHTVIDGSTVRYHWSKILDKAKIKENLHIHDIRHIIGTILRDSGVNEELRALVLGHTRSSVTARYASQNAKLADEIYQFFLDKIHGTIDPNTKWIDS